jgi:hypothetical protein
MYQSTAVVNPTLVPPDVVAELSTVELEGLRFAQQCYMPLTGSLAKKVREKVMEKELEKHGK